MGLLLTIPKEKNTFYIDFNNAYWSIDEIQYTPNQCVFRLIAYPSREAKLKQNQEIDLFPFGGAIGGMIYRPALHEWDGFVEWKTLFPNGLPVSENEQKTAIYNYIKAYTNLPFQDVFEEGQQ